MSTFSSIFNGSEEVPAIIANGLRELEKINRFNRSIGLPERTWFFAETPLDSIDVKFYDEETCTGYQRKDNGVSKDIINDFKDGKIDVKSVSYDAKTGRFMLLDGNHTYIAMKALGFQTMPTKVFYNMTEEEQAAFFSEQDENKTKVSTIDKFFADITAKRDYALTIKRVTDEFGLRIKKSKAGQKHECYTITSIRDLKMIERKYGEDGLRFTFQIIFNAGWEKFDDAFTRINLLIGYKAYTLCKNNNEKKGKLFRAMSSCNCPKDFAARYTEDPKFRQYSSTMHPEGSLTKYIEYIVNN